MPYPSAISVQPEQPTWREAASLIILAQNDSTGETPSPYYNFDYSLLMVKRSAGSSFMASAFVFPGGQVELSDFDFKWYSLFEKCGFDKSKLDSLSLNIVGPRPPLVTDSVTLEKAKQKQPSLQLINSDIGLRISSIRETFEEAGILLLTDPNQIDADCANAILLPSEDLHEWQTRVRNDSNAFFELCQTLKMVPNIWSLYEWSDWLTPVSVGHRRFDTIFYVCCLRKQPHVKVDNAEITKPLWCTPSYILEEHCQERVFLAPPQVYELSRMLHFTKMNRFTQFLKARQVLGTQRWLPVMFTYDDGALSILPGDECYPVEPQLVSSMPLAELDGTLDEANSKSTIFNRIELRGTQCRTFCNIEPGCGHMSPISFPPAQPSSSSIENVKSKL